MKKVIPLGIGLALCSTLAMAQTPFKGKVFDENGEPVIGASIIIVGTNRGTITGIDGSFTLTPPEGSKQIKVSFVGMVPQTVGIKPDLKITLKSDSQNLDEIVVIAYGQELFHRSEEKLSRTCLVLRSTKCYKDVLPV